MTSENTEFKTTGTMGAQGTRKDSDNQSKAKYSKKKKNKYKKKSGKSNGAKVHRFI